MRVPSFDRINKSLKISILTKLQSLKLGGILQIGFFTKYELFLQT